MKKLSLLPTLLLAALLLSGTSLMASGGEEGNKAELETDATAAGTTAFELTSALPSSVRRGETFSLQLDAEREGVSQVRLLDKQGRNVHGVSVTLDKGSNLLEIGLGDLASGVYFLEISSGGNAETRALSIR